MMYDFANVETPRKSPRKAIYRQSTFSGEIEAIYNAYKPHDSFDATNIVAQVSTLLRKRGYSYLKRMEHIQALLSSQRDSLGTDEEACVSQLLRLTGTYLEQRRSQHREIKHYDQVLEKMESISPQSLFTFTPRASRLESVLETDLSPPISPRYEFTNSFSQTPRSSAEPSQLEWVTTPIPGTDTEIHSVKGYEPHLGFFSSQPPQDPPTPTRNYGSFRRKAAWLGVLVLAGIAGMGAVISSRTSPATNSASPLGATTSKISSVEHAVPQTRTLEAETNTLHQALQAAYQREATQKEALTNMERKTEAVQQQVLTLRDEFTTYKQERVKAEQIYLQQQAAAAAAAQKQRVMSQEIHQFMSSDMVTLPSFGLTYGTISSQSQSYNAKRLTYVQPGFVNTPTEFTALVDAISVAYTPHSIHPQAFERLATQIGLGTNFIGAFEQDSGKASKFDAFAQYLFARNQSQDGSVYYNNAQGTLCAVMGVDQVPILHTKLGTRKYE